MDTKALRNLYNASKELAEATDSNMPFHQALILYVIALHDADGGIELREIGQEVGLPSSSTSRNVAALGEWHRLQRPGLGLVETVTNYEDRRRKPVRLTKKGRTVVEKVLRRLK